MNAWLRALELTAQIPKRPDRILPTVVDEFADRFGDAPALSSDDETLSYRSLAERSRQYARWAIERGITKGDCVGLLMPNRPEYVAAWLGVSKVGGVVALLNTNLAREALAHAIKTVTPRYVIVDRQLDSTIDRYSSEPLSADECAPVTIADRALYIFTSGTTGVSKAANVSHGRVMQWSHWFAGLMDVGPSDRMYDCLPMYHSVGGVVAIGAALAGGGSVVIRERFSASRFWSDIAATDCTLFQYIGELCRYLAHADPQPHETAHRIRIACGNGLRADVWNAFRERFRIPQILEFYASTEGNVSLVNVDGVPGAIGRVPRYLTHRPPVTLVQHDPDTDAPVRDAGGRCVRCAPNEPGEAIAPLGGDRSAIAARFEGYTDPGASQQKILHDVFTAGDAWFRTGDLMRQDERGYFFFVDRVGDTFRWKGENVATSEVAAAICTFEGVKDANVYGVAIPGTDGRAGMAAIVADDGLDFRALRTHLRNRLPDYALPVFLRLRDGLDLTTTFKHVKSDLARQGFDPAAIGDAIYFNDRERESFVRLDTSLYESIQKSAVRI
jgi:fatty-acyl-CoA synthase